MPERICPFGFTPVLASGLPALSRTVFITASCHRPSVMAGVPEAVPLPSTMMTASYLFDGEAVMPYWPAKMLASFKP